jgi:hypothetical protein
MTTPRHAPRETETEPARGDPYFFMTYAHAPPIPGQEDDPDELFVRVRTDLSRHIMHLTDHPANSEVGFMDRWSIPPGAGWLDDIKKRLARCRVLLAFYSDRYFNSTWCGREWHAFTVREELHAFATGTRVHAIVPVLWTPVERMPEIVGRRQLISAGLCERYRREGLYGLAVSRAYEDDYHATTYEIAKAIVLTARSTRLRPCDPAAFPELRNVFEEGEEEP